MNKYIVHCRKDLYDIYIGRPSKWGNPYKIGGKSTRELVIEHYRKKIIEDSEFITQIKLELKGKILGCWCAPLACHGDVLAEIANE